MSFQVQPEVEREVMKNLLFVTVALSWVIGCGQMTDQLGNHQDANAKRTSAESSSVKRCVAISSNTSGITTSDTEVLFTVNANEDCPEGTQDELCSSEFGDPTTLPVPEDKGVPADKGGNPPPPPPVPVPVPEPTPTQSGDGKVPPVVPVPVPVPLPTPVPPPAKPGRTCPNKRGGHNGPSVPSLPVPAPVPGKVGCPTKPANGDKNCPNQGGSGSGKGPV